MSERNADNSPPVGEESFFSFAPSSTSFHLFHPIVRFFSSIGLQGYAQSVVSELNISSMEELCRIILPCPTVEGGTGHSMKCFTGDVSGVVALIGENAPRQHYIDILKGAQQWERERRREANARRKQDAAAAAKRVKAEKAAAAVSVGGGKGKKRKGVKKTSASAGGEERSIDKALLDAIWRAANEVKQKPDSASMNLDRPSSTSLSNSVKCKIKEQESSRMETRENSEAPGVSVESSRLSSGLDPFSPLLSLSPPLAVPSSTFSLSTRPSPSAVVNANSEIILPYSSPPPLAIPSPSPHQNTNLMLLPAAAAPCTTHVDKGNSSVCESMSENTAATTTSPTPIVGCSKSHSPPPPPEVSPTLMMRRYFWRGGQHQKKSTSLHQEGSTKYDSGEPPLAPPACFSPSRLPVSLKMKGGTGMVEVLDVDAISDGDESMEVEEIEKEKAKYFLLPLRPESFAEPSPSFTTEKEEEEEENNMDQIRGEKWCCSPSHRSDGGDSGYDGHEEKGKKAGKSELSVGTAHRKTQREEEKEGSDKGEEGRRRKIETYEVTGWKISEPIADKEEIEKAMEDEKKEGKENTLSPTFVGSSPPPSHLFCHDAKTSNHHPSQNSDGGVVMEGEGGKLEVKSTLSMKNEVRKPSFPIDSPFRSSSSSSSSLCLGKEEVNNPPTCPLLPSPQSSSSLEVEEEDVPPRMVSLISFCEHEGTQKSCVASTCSQTQRSASTGSSAAPWNEMIHDLNVIPLQSSECRTSSMTPSKEEEESTTPIFPSPLSIHVPRRTSTSTSPFSSCTLYDRMEKERKEDECGLHLRRASSSLSASVSLFLPPSHQDHQYDGGGGGTVAGPVGSEAKQHEKGWLTNKENHKSTSHEGKEVLRDDATQERERAKRENRAWKRSRGETERDGREKGQRCIFYRVDCLTHWTAGHSVLDSGFDEALEADERKIGRIGVSEGGQAERATQEVRSVSSPSPVAHLKDGEPERRSNASGKDPNTAHEQDEEEEEKNIKRQKEVEARDGSAVALPALEKQNNEVFFPRNSQYSLGRERRGKEEKGKEEEREEDGNNKKLFPTVREEEACEGWISPLPCINPHCGVEMKSSSRSTSRRERSAVPLLQVREQMRCPEAEEKEVIRLVGEDEGMEKDDESTTPHHLKRSESIQDLSKGIIPAVAAPSSFPSLSPLPPAPPVVGVGAVGHEKARKEDMRHSDHFFPLFSSQPQEGREDNNDDNNGNDDWWLDCFGLESIPPPTQLVVTPAVGVEEGREKQKQEEEKEEQVAEDSKGDDCGVGPHTQRSSAAFLPPLPSMTAGDVSVSSSPSLLLLSPPPPSSSALPPPLSPVPPRPPASPFSSPVRFFSSSSRSLWSSTSPSTQISSQLSLSPPPSFSFLSADQMEEGKGRSRQDDDEAGEGKEWKTEEEGKELSRDGPPFTGIPNVHHADRKNDAVEDHRDDLVLVSPTSTTPPRSCMKTAMTSHFHIKGRSKDDEYGNSSGAEDRDDGCRTAFTESGVWKTRTGGDAREKGERGRITPSSRSAPGEEDHPSCAGISFGTSSSSSSFSPSSSFFTIHSPPLPSPSLSASGKNIHCGLHSQRNHSSLSSPIRVASSSIPSPLTTNGASLVKELDYDHDNGVTMVDPDTNEDDAQEIRNIQTIFRKEVVPFYFHRLARYSGLPPYHRVRAKELLEMDRTCRMEVESGRLGVAPFEEEHKRIENREGGRIACCPSLPTPRVVPDALFDDDHSPWSLPLTEEEAENEEMNEYTRCVISALCAHTVETRNLLPPRHPSCPGKNSVKYPHHCSPPSPLPPPDDHTYSNSLSPSHSVCGEANILFSSSLPSSQTSMSVPPLPGSSSTWTPLEELWMTAPVDLPSTVAVVQREFPFISTSRLQGLLQSNGVVSDVCRSSSSPFSSSFFQSFGSSAISSSKK